MDVLAFPSMIFSPTGSLIESLIHISKEVCSTQNLSTFQVRNANTVIRRVKLLLSFFEDIQETHSSLPQSSIVCLTELFSVIRRVNLLIQACRDGSSLWGLMQTEFVSDRFYVLVKELGSALDILPLSLLNISADVREQVKLLHEQVKRAELYIDIKELQRREELLQLIARRDDKNTKKLRILDVGKVREILSSIGLKTRLDYEEEILKLEAEVQKQAGTGGLKVVSNINNLISFVSYSMSMIFSDHDEKENERLNNNKLSSCSFYTSSSSSNINYDCSLSALSASSPDEFRCPISLELMRDPVIVASGHTYDRDSIAKWINSGHHTCPKSGQRLIHVALIPNYALKSLMRQWCQDNNVSPSEDPKLVSISDGSETSGHKRWLCESAVDHISAVKAAADAVKLTAEFLVGKLATGSPEIQRQAAYELRLLAKTSMDNRRIISEAGAIPFLVTLLNSHDPRIQEHTITALLNLSIFDNNKILIMAAGAIDNIISVLELGKTMKARENAAATIFSLSMIDDCKVAIGTRPRAIPALVELLKEGTSAGKKDAVTALFNLSVHDANKVSIVVAGLIPLLVESLMDDTAAITDDALAVLAMLLGCGEGLEEIRKSKVLVRILIDLLRFGSPKGKENSITLLLGLCKNGGEDVARRMLMNPHSIPALQGLAAEGSLRAQRKADALLRLLNRCCSRSLNQVTL